MRDDRERFDEAGARVLLIAMGPHTRAALFCDERHVPFTCLSDPEPERAAYHAYGLERGRGLQIFSPKTILRATQLTAKGFVTGYTPGDDYRQMPGTFVIDTDGIVAYAHRNRDVQDNPSNDEVLAAVAGVGAA